MIAKQEKILQKICQKESLHFLSYIVTLTPIIMTKTTIKNIFDKKIVSDTDKLREIFYRNESDKYTLKEIDKYSFNAIKALDCLDNDNSKNLIDLTRYCSTRTR